MPVFSRAAWVLHDLGLATSIGGTLFAKTAFQPALHAVSSPEERDRASDIAWTRFSILNLLGHVAVAGSWLVGRAFLSGREPSRQSRNLTVAKDILVGAALVTGLSSILGGRLLDRRVQRGVGPVTAKARALPDAASTSRLSRVTDVLGHANLLSNAGVLATTTLLAMEAGKSGRFSLLSRLLP